MTLRHCLVQGIEFEGIENGNGNGNGHKIGSGNKF